MSWKKLIGKSLTLVLGAVAGLTLAIPKASPQSPCGPWEGKLCIEDCVRECESGGCCSWRYYYYPKKTE